MADMSLRKSPLAKMIFPGGLKERDFTTQINLRGNPSEAAFAETAKSVLGIDLPSTPNTVSSGEDLSILWLGPDEWLIVAADNKESEIPDQLAAAFLDQHVAINNLSANRCVMELSGPHSLDALMKSCDMDLHPRVFGAGQVVQTVIAKSQAIIENKGEGTYHIYVRCSFSRYVAEWLCDALQEYQE
jgi:sarcosine oxidase, subunit gamma